MDSIFEKLQQYFNDTSKEQLLKDWKSTEEFDTISSPSVDEFLINSCLFMEVEISPPDGMGINFVNINESPNFTSDFLIVNS